MASLMIRAAAAVRDGDTTLTSWTYEPRPLQPEDVDIRVTAAGVCHRFVVPPQESSALAAPLRATTPLRATSLPLCSRQPWPMAATRAARPHGAAAQRDKPN